MSRTAADAITTAEWIETQHHMRSPTEAILFWPEPTMEVHDKWADELDADEEANPHVFIEKEKISSVTFDLQGHSGALYVRQGDKKVPQTRGQGEFHDDLRRMVRASETPKDYRSQLTSFLKKDKGIWNGNIDFLPDDWKEDEHKAIRTLHEGKNAKPLGGNLFLVADSVKNDFKDVLKVVAG